MPKTKTADWSIGRDINWENLANMLLDQAIEMYGIFETCKSLFDSGYTTRQLYYLGFEKETIKEVKAVLVCERKQYKELQKRTR